MCLLAVCYVTRPERDQTNRPKILVPVFITCITTYYIVLKVKINLSALTYFTHKAKLKILWVFAAKPELRGCSAFRQVYMPHNLNKKHVQKYFSLVCFLVCVNVYYYKIVKKLYFCLYNALVRGIGNKPVFISQDFI